MSKTAWRGKRVAVIGAAATGLATAAVLRDLGARVRLCDRRREDELPGEVVSAARALDGVTLEFGAADWGEIAPDLVVPSPGVPRSAHALQEALRGGIPILGEIEIAYRLARAPILAITGTNGKTTTTALLGAICRASGRATWVAGNIAEDEGKRLPLIQAAVEAPADGVIVAEISSFQLEWVDRFRPKVAAWLNLADDHLDRHADRNEYGRAKARLFAAQTPNDFAVLNADDGDVLRLSDGVEQGRRLLFSLRGPVGAGAFLAADGTLQLIKEDGGEPIALMSCAEIPIPGRHSVANVLAAAAMASAFGIAPEAIRAGVRGFRGVAHRMETVAAIGGVRYVNNSMCTNPAAVAASLEAANGSVVAIVGGQHKGGDLAPMAAAIRQHARKVVLIGASTPELASALRATSMDADDVLRAATLPEAVEKAAALARPGETVMLVPGCASFDMFTGFEHRGQVFRDAVGALAKGSTKGAAR